MSRPAAVAHGEARLRSVNQSFYGSLWRDARLVPPQRFNTWPLFSTLARQAPRRLEVAPGLRPRLPLEDTRFVDVSAPALQRLHRSGASVAQGLISAIPFPDQAFDLVCALDVVEHVEDDDRALAELARVAAPGATLLLSVPLHPEAWTAFDDLVGHRRRYEPQQVLHKLEAHGLVLQQSAVYGMQPRSSRLLDYGMWYLVNRRKQAMWWYNRIGMPLALYFQSKLVLVPGMIATQGVDEVLLVCRKQG